MRVYAQQKIPHLWLIDPIHKTLETYRFQSGSFMLAGVHEGNEKVRAELFPEVEMDLSNLWWEA